MARTTISNTDDVIDSRSIIDRIEELESEREALQDEVETTAEAVADTLVELDDARERNAGDKDGPEIQVAEENHERAKESEAAALETITEWDDSEDADELKALKKLAAEAEQYSSDWEHGETLIHESYWVDYCKELCQEIGDMPKEIPNYIVIDWEATAENLKADYTAVDFDGEAYYICSC